MHRILNSENSILRFSLHLLGTLTFFGSIMFFVQAVQFPVKLNINIIYAIIGFGISISVFCFFAAKFPALRFAALILLSFFIAITGSFQQMNIALLFIIPIYLGYCLQNRHKLFAITLLDILFFNLSKVFKSYNIYIANPRVYNFKNVLISNMIVSLFESIVFLVIAIPVFWLLVKQNNELKKSLDEKNEATNDILDFCSTATSFHNKYLSVHIKGVRDITKIILDALIEEGVYIEENYYKQIIFSVQFHDIGKIYIDSSILDKKDRLTTSEFDLIKEHPQRGLELFSLLPKNVLDENYTQTCKNVIYQHHERLDGTGYPTGTKDISFEAKIVAIADVVDALLSWRPYKPPLKWEKMVEILEENKSGYSNECINVVYKNRDKILAVSDEHNKTLQNLLALDYNEIIRK